MKFRILVLFLLGLAIGACEKPLYTYDYYLITITDGTNTWIEVARHSVDINMDMQTVKFTNANNDSIALAIKPGYTVSVKLIKDVVDFSFGGIEPPKDSEVYQHWLTTNGGSPIPTITPVPSPTPTATPFWN